MREKVLLIAGTEDGRELGRYLIEQGYKVLATAASEYGGELLSENEGIETMTGRKNAEELAEVIREEGIRYVIDASHPYAEEVTANAKEASKETGAEYIRYERERLEVKYERVRKVRNYEEAAREAKKLGKRILLTTGSKKLGELVKELKGCELTVRVLPTAEVLRECERLGLKPRQIIAMQGAFSKGMNVETYRHSGAEVVVMKESGRVGGEDTKMEAAEELGLPVVLIERPREEYERKASSYEGVRKLMEGRE